MIEALCFFIHFPSSGRRTSLIGLKWYSLLTGMVSHIHPSFVRILVRWVKLSLENCTVSSSTNTSALDIFSKNPHHGK
jgi:hypothetical protein